MEESHVIETDYEVDDALFKTMHCASSKDIDLNIIVGEGNPASKIKKVEEFNKKLQQQFKDSYKSVTVYQGLGSDKKGCDPETGDQRDSEETILNNYKKVYSKNPTKAFMIKPPREAMKLKLNCPNTVVHCYGGFNWRTLGLPLQEYSDFVNRYKKFYYYDSFSAIGEANSADYKGSDPTILERISDWNNYILEDVKKSLLTTTNEESIKRKQKIIKNIESNPKQFVLADVCLMGTSPNVPAKLVSVDPYPKWEKCEDSNTFVFMDSLQAQRREALIKLINEIC